MTSSRTASMVRKTPHGRWHKDLAGSASRSAPPRCSPRGMISRWLGMKDSEPVLQAYGVREIATGIEILAAHNPSGWLWVGSPAMA
jgi:hypothetical protein